MVTLRHFTHFRFAITAVFAAVVLAACASAGAPPPGELAEESCEVGELLYCPERQASRIKSEYGTCYCRPAERMQIP